MPLFAALRMLFGNTEVIIGQSRSLIRNAVYLSIAERVRTKSNYRPLLTHPSATSILHYSTLSPGCRQTLTPTHVHVHIYTATMHEVIKIMCYVRYGITALNDDESCVHRLPVFTCIWMWHVTRTFFYKNAVKLPGFTWFHSLNGSLN